MANTLETLPRDSSEVPEETAALPTSGLKWLNWSSLLLAFIQSVCSAFIALSSIRLFIGAAAFASALGVVKFADKLHIAAIRIPMMLIALVGSVVNLLALWQVWRLRRRSASAWRQKAIPAKQKRSERLQFAFSVITLVLLAVEYWAHWKLFGHQ
jgi:heme/copper-type cytochrome/quinol oxidase subunit 2